MLANKLFFGGNYLTNLQPKEPIQMQISLTL